VQSQIVLGWEGVDGTSVITSQAVPPPPGPPPILVTSGSALTFSTFPFVPRHPPVIGPNPPPPPPVPLEHLRIDPNGNVGVDTKTPITKLDVRGQGSFQGPLAINNAAAKVGLGSIHDNRAAITFGATDNPSAFYVGASTSDTLAKTDFGLYSYLTKKWIQTWAPSGDVSFAANVSAEGGVDVAGDVRVAGDVLLTGADCAEQFDAADPHLPEPGEVVVIGEEGALRGSRQPYDKKVAGVVSGAGEYRHGIVLDRRLSDRQRIAVAMVGKVFCKVDAEYAPIEVGDLLTTSPTPGHAMKATDPAKSFGSVLGKALRGLVDGQGIIPILVTLQ
jgi:hypothetical protein